MSTEKDREVVQPATTPFVPPPQPKPPTPGKSFWDVAQPFVIGGTSGCIATTVIQPIDMIKVQIQLKSEEISVAKKAGKTVNLNISPLATIKEIASTGGLKAFYKG